MRLLVTNMNPLTSINTRAVAFLDLLIRPKSEHVMRKFLVWAFVVDLIIVPALFVKLFFNPWETPFVMAQDNEVGIHAGTATQAFLQEMTYGTSTPNVIGKVKRAPLTVRGTSVSLDGDNLQIFEFPDHGQAVAEAAQFLAKYRARSHFQVWEDALRVYVHDRIVILYMGKKDSITERFAFLGLNPEM